VATVFQPDVAPAYDRFLAELIRRHGEVVFAPEGETVDELVARLLTDGGRWIATGESCTGGLLAARLTERAGSSAYVAGGAVTYADAAKTALLGVDPALITAHGAVSPEVAAAMAIGARERFGADLGVGITGIAGPGGGTPEKPVGTVCVDVSSADGGHIARTVLLPGDRTLIRERTTTVALHLVRRLLQGHTSLPGR
jgi:nicotinamide-nucleotide amidase